MTPKAEVQKPNKRAKGEGTIYRRASDGMYCASVELPSPGATRRRKVVTAATEAQVKQKLRLLKVELAKHGDLPTSSQTTGTWLNYWFESIALKKVRPKTGATYRTLLVNHIIPAVGKIRLDKLTPAHILAMNDAITDKGLSSTTAMQAHRILAVALKYAEREGRVTKNVATLTDAPRKATTNLTVLTAADGVKVLQTAASDPLGARWAAALLTGARQGELLGLQVDRVTDVLDLSWQLQRLSWEHGCDPDCGRKRGSECPKRKVTFPADWEHKYLTGGLWLSRPKSNAGWRIIPLVEPLKTILERHLAASEPNRYGLVWANKGQPIDPGADNRAWHDLLERADVPDARLHDARHTTASLLLAAGVPEPIIMKILGHNSYVITRAYQNVDESQLRDALTKVSERLAIYPQ